MSDGAASPDDPPSRLLPVLLLLFVGSGCAALVYEVVWFQLLQLVIGSSAISLGVLLGTFMGGMCLGSWLLPRFVSRVRHPLRVYAGLELGIAACGLVLLHGVPLIWHAYAALGGHIVLRAIVAGVCLLPPTLLMGATLPALARWVETTPRGVAWLGYFYGGNIAGAVAGSLLAGFYLLRVYDQSVATYVAVALNLAVALAAFLVARGAAYAPAAESGVAPPSAKGARSVYVIIALSGFTALSAEVLWTRLLSLVFGATVYTFALILAGFLAGLGVGSAFGSALSRRRIDARVALGWCQMLIAGSLAWAAYMLTESLPYWPIDPQITVGPWFNFQLDLVRCLWVVLPGAVLWGASFPLALAAAAREGQDPGRLVGGVYAANTIGAIAGSLLTALVVVAWIGTQHAQSVLILVATGAALLALVPPLVRGGAGLRRRGLGAAALLVASCASGFLAYTVAPVPGLLAAHGRYSATWVGLSEVVHVAEGMNAFVAVTRMPDGALIYHNAGKGQASSRARDMGLQRRLGHLTHLIPEKPANVLVIGCGAGVTAGAVAIGPDVERVTIAEIEPLVPTTVSNWFSEYNYDVVNNPKVTIDIDDGRHFLLTSGQMFDAVTSDPLDPWVKGAAALYTVEFLETVKEHLNPGGVVTVFVQLYECDRESVRSQLATFFDVFPNGVVWGNTNEGRGYDLVLMGQVEPIRIDLDRIAAQLESLEYAQIAQSLREIEITDEVELFATYAGSAEDLAGWLEGAEINRDRNMRLQYLAGLSFNHYDSVSIYSEMLEQARFPDAMFTGTPKRLRALRHAISEARAKGLE